MTSMSPYQYQPLQPGEIRLLQLLPRNPDVQDDPIRFHIVHTPFERCDTLDSFFSYEAVSYVWGGDRTDPVYSDDREILVTPNLISALSRLRETMPKYPSFHRTLWVDSICINQDDILERGEQVRIMRDIYSHATRVVIWLGGGQAVEENLTLIKNGHMPQDDIEARLGHRYFASWGESVAKVFDLPWFHRVWVIQEVVFAAKAIILGRRTSIRWAQLVHVAVSGKENAYITPWQRSRCDTILGIEYLRNHIRKGDHSNVKLQLRSNGNPSKQYQQMKLALNPSIQPRLPKDLLELAELFRSHSATDPRDKIYALLGLASALDTDRLATHIDSNYNLDAKILFMEFARLVISGPAALRLLRNVYGSRDQSSSLPSWVPDWSISLKIRPLAELLKPYHLLSNQRAVILKHPSPGVLKLVGKRIDTIKAMGEVLNESSGEASLHIWKSWVSLGRKHGLIPPRAFNWSAFVVPQDLGRSQTEIPKHCSQICFGRRYLLTKQGHAGLVPAEARVGDRIILFPGAELPFVISKDDSDNMFYIVGECYLDRVSLDSLLQDKNCKTGTYCLK